MHFVGKSNTPEPSKDCWRTPTEIFNSLNREFKFTLDACADSRNTLCANYFSIENSALNNEWDYPSIFINPPYSNTKQFLEYAAIQAKKHNTTVVALVNANTDTAWFREAYNTAQEIRLISGRLSFKTPEGTTVQGNTKGQCIIIWKGKSDNPCSISLIERNKI